MRRPLSRALGCLVALLLAACTNSNAGTDLGVVEPGCRAPSACYLVGADCSCARGSVETLASSLGCKACDPLTQMCVCAPSQRCYEPAQVCVGRAAATCAGVGARCLPAGSTCSTSGGAAPNLVGTGMNGALEPRCTYVDDVCCPGTANTDAGL